MRAAPGAEEEREGESATMRAALRAIQERLWVSLCGYAEAVITRPPAAVRGAGLIVAVQGATGL